MLRSVRPRCTFMTPFGQCEREQHDSSVRCLVTREYTARVTDEGTIDYFPPPEDRDPTRAA